MSENYDYQPYVDSVEDAGATISETINEVVESVQENVADIAEYAENIDAEQITENLSENISESVDQAVESIQELLPEESNSILEPKEFGYTIVDDPVIQRLNNTEQGYTGPIVIILIILIIIGGIVGYFIYRRKQLTAIPQSDPDEDVEAGVATEEEQNLNEQYDTTVKAEQL